MNLSERIPQYSKLLYRFSENTTNDKKRHRWQLPCPAVFSNCVRVPWNDENRRTYT